MKDFIELPSEGMTGEQILKVVSDIIELGDSDWRDGSQSGTVYNGIYFIYLFIKIRLKLLQSTIIKLIRVSNGAKSKGYSIKHVLKNLRFKKVISLTVQF